MYNLKHVHLALRNNLLTTFISVSNNLGTQFSVVVFIIVLRLLVVFNTWLVTSFYLFWHIDLYINETIHITCNHLTITYILDCYCLFINNFYKILRLVAKLDSYSNLNNCILNIACLIALSLFLSSL